MRAWERASDPDFAGQYSYLFSFIEGGQEKLDGEADTISGVTDDEARTLTVGLSAPYGNFPAVAGFQLFFPMPSAVDDLEDQTEWENGLMIGNGPYKLAEPRNDQQIVVERNDEWGGDIFGNDKAPPSTRSPSASHRTRTRRSTHSRPVTATPPPSPPVGGQRPTTTTRPTPILATNYFELNMRTR